MTPCSDVCGLVAQHVELYRRTAASLGEAQLSALAPEARERALQQQMRAAGQSGGGQGWAALACMHGHWLPMGMDTMELNHGRFSCKHVIVLHARQSPN